MRVNWCDPAAFALGLIHLQQDDRRAGWLELLVKEIGSTPILERLAFFKMPTDRRADRLLVPDIIGEGIDILGRQIDAA